MHSEERKHDTKAKQDEIDWESLRIRSVQPGGFGEERVDIWPKVLHVSKSKLPSNTQKSSNESPVDDIDKPPHQDERQIGLDTDRSFVLYPVEDPTYDRETLQAGLYELLVSFFRKRPRLSYFQGYHDIVTVIFLTLPAELQLSCVEKLSLHRLRDSMGTGLEPVLGLLRVTTNLLQLADPDYANALEQSSPLPFYALSNLLTLFSHDMPTLPLIQHVFDYLLCRPPIAAVYLATAIILSRKQEVLRLEEEGEDGMIHSLLSSLPNLVDGNDILEQPTPTSTSPWTKEEDLSLADADTTSNSTFFKQEDDEIAPFAVKEEERKEETLDDVLNTIDTLPVVDDVGNNLSAKISHINVVDGEDSPDASGHETDTVYPSDATAVDDDQHTPRTPSPTIANGQANDGAATSTSSETSDIPALDVTGSASIPSVKTEHTEAIDDLPNATAVDSTGVVDSKPEPEHQPQGQEMGEHERPQQQRPEKPPLQLTDLLKRADALYTEFPPSHAALRLSSIMGPQSVVFTWSESPSKLPSDSTAEAMVQHPELVVYPYVEPAAEDGSDASENEQEKNSGSGWGFRRRKGKERASNTNKSKTGKDAGGRKRRKNKLRKLPFSHMEKRTMVAGTVLVLGVALAIYGVRARSAAGVGHGGTAGLFQSFADPRAHGGNAASAAKDWKRFGGWVGGALVGMSEKIMNGLSSGNGDAS